MCIVLWLLLCGSSSLGKMLYVEFILSKLNIRFTIFLDDLINIKFYSRLSDRIGSAFTWFVAADQWTVMDSVSTTVISCLGSSWPHLIHPPPSCLALWFGRLRLLIGWRRTPEQVAVLGAEVAACRDNVASRRWGQTERQPKNSKMDDDLFQLRQLPWVDYSLHFNASRFYSDNFQPCQHAWTMRRPRTDPHCFCVCCPESL